MKEKEREGTEIKGTKSKEKKRKGGEVIKVKKY